MQKKSTNLEAIPGQCQRHSAFLWDQQIDQPKQKLQHVYRVSRYPQLIGHLEKSCKLPQPKQHINI